MPKTKVLSGPDIIKSLEDCGFSVVRQKGSHVRLSRHFLDKSQYATIPNHTEISRGTQAEIIRQLNAFLTQEQIKDIFYTK